MPSRKNRNASAHVASNVAANLIAKVAPAPKAIAAPQQDDRSALERIEPVMAAAIRKVAEATVDEMISDALVTATNGFEEWKAVKDLRYTEVKARVARMYENERLGKLALRGLEKKAAKEALWSALFENETFVRINNEHKALVERKQASYEKRTQWAIENQNNRKGRVIREEEIADYGEVQAYMAAQRRANG